MSPRIIEQVGTDTEIITFIPPSMTSGSLSSIEHAIIFILAPWSGPAVMAQKLLMAFLEQHSFPLKKFICLNGDQEPWIHQVPELLGKLHGWGEVVVVKDGRIVFFTVLGKDRNHLEECCEELMKVYRGGAATHDSE